MAGGDGIYPGRGMNGGRAVVTKYGREHMRELGRLGAQKRHAKGASA